MPGAAPLWGQVQVSPASVVTELDAVVGVALEAADDDYAIFLTSFMCCTLARTVAWTQGDCAGARSGPISPDESGGLAHDHAR